MSIFENNVVVLTGASSGIGHQLALQLAERGAHWLKLISPGTLDKIALKSIQKGRKASKSRSVKQSAGVYNTGGIINRRRNLLILSNDSHRERLQVSSCLKPLFHISR